MAKTSTPTADHAAVEDGDVHVHAHPLSMYLGVFGALIVLTLLTVGAYQVHLGAANLVVAVLIATVKASLVVMYFMHLRDDARFNALIFVGSLLFAGVFLAYTINDTKYRGDVDGVSGLRYDPATGEWAAGTSPELISESEASEGSE
ncbi:MAG TPA: cytochrome C oxidase subunit IV family protein [Polyangiaceae bacterium LLY-WYZ-14_1]|nr:cytochrome C oxidase subunit IV family protein [Polyangiaceae bacterium LLY-WYZ-14_1]